MRFGIVGMMSKSDFDFLEKANLAALIMYLALCVAVGVAITLVLSLWR